MGKMTGSRRRETGLLSSVFGQEEIIFLNLDKVIVNFYDNQMKIILASRSPRRKMFLKQLGIPFIIKVAKIEEITFNNPVESCIYNATQKVKWVANNIKLDKNSIIIGFDTLVYFEGRIIGKPKNRDESKKMLRALGGKWHEVYTGVALWDDGKIKSDYEKTSVKFHDLTESHLDFYVNSGETLDKAGSYGIQDKNISFINRIDGSFTNVVGFPLSVTRNLLKEAGVVT